MRGSGTILLLGACLGCGRATVPPDPPLPEVEGTPALPAPPFRPALVTHLVGRAHGGVLVTLDGRLAVATVGAEAMWVDPLPTASGAERPPPPTGVVLAHLGPADPARPGVAITARLRAADGRTWEFRNLGEEAPFGAGLLPEKDEAACLIQGCGCRSPILHVRDRLDTMEGNRERALRAGDATLAAAMSESIDAFLRDALTRYAQRRRPAAAPTSPR